MDGRWTRVSLSLSERSRIGSLCVTECAFKPARFSSADVEISRAKSDLTFFALFNAAFLSLPRNRLVPSFETRAYEKKKKKKDGGCKLKSRRSWPGWKRNGGGRENLHELEALSGSRTKFIAGIEREKVSERGRGSCQFGRVGWTQRKSWFAQMKNARLPTFWFLSHPSLHTFHVLLSF